MHSVSLQPVYLRRDDFRSQLVQQLAPLRIGVILQETAGAAAGAEGTVHAWFCMHGWMHVAMARRAVPVTRGSRACDRMRALLDRL